jgi:hypothetical protein
MRAVAKKGSARATAARRRENTFAGLKKWKVQAAILLRRVGLISAPGINFFDKPRQATENPPGQTKETESMIRNVLIATGLGLFALAAAPMAPVISDAPGMSAAAQPKTTTKKKKAAKKSNVQSKVTYDSGTRRYMTSSDMKYRYGR